MPTELTRTEARGYFESCNISYLDVDLQALQYLETELNIQFNLVARDCLNGNHRYPSGETKPRYWVRVNPAKYYKGRYDTKDGHLLYAAMTATGTYFTAREVITFESDGFISFAGEADRINVQPVLRAFLNWCDWLKCRKVEQHGA